MYVDYTHHEHKKSCTNRVKNIYRLYGPVRVKFDHDHTSPTLVYLWMCNKDITYHICFMTEFLYLKNYILINLLLDIVSISILVRFAKRWFNLIITSCAPLI